MRMSEGIEWGIHCCSLLAVLEDGETLTGGRMSEFFMVPRTYLLKNLRALSRAGILRATTGARGGYRLARPAREITVLEIVEAIEGVEPAFHCSEIRQRGPSGLPAAAYPAPCGIAVTMWRAEAAWREVLRGITLGEIVALGRREVPAAQRELAHDWLARATADHA